MGASQGERPAPAPTSLPFLAFAAFLTLAAGASWRPGSGERRGRGAHRAPRAPCCCCCCCLRWAWVREHWPLGPELRVLRPRPQGPLSRKPSQSRLQECQKKKKKKNLSKEEGLGATEPGCCSGEHPPSILAPPSETVIVSRILKNTCLSSELTSAGQFSGRRWVTLFPGLTEASHENVRRVLAFLHFIVEGN